MLKKTCALRGRDGRVWSSAAGPNHAGFDQRLELFFRRSLEDTSSGATVAPAAGAGAALAAALASAAFGQLLGVLRGFRMLVLEGLQLPDLLGRMKRGTGKSPSWNLCSYSKNFTTMNVQAHKMVMVMFSTSSLR